MFLCNFPHCSFAKAAFSRAVAQAFSIIRGNLGGACPEELLCNATALLLVPEGQGGSSGIPWSDPERLPELCRAQRLH